MSHDTRIKAYVHDYLCPEQQVTFLAFVNKLQFLWRKIGFNEKEVVERFSNVLERYEVINDDLLQENEVMINNLSLNIKQHELELQQLYSELGIEAKDVNMSLPLLQKQNAIYARLGDLRQIKHYRVEQYKKLREDEDVLCSFLKMSKVFKIPSAIPKMHHLHELEENIKTLSDVKKQRITAYNSFKERLLKLLDETDFVPENSIKLDDKHALTELSQEKLDHMKGIVEKGQQFQQHITEEIKKLTKKMKSLWDDLNMDEKLQQDFIKAHSQIRQSTIDAMESEIESCGQQIIIREVTHLRKQLVDLWDYCLVGNDKRKEFESFYCQGYDDDVLQAHIAEVDRLRKYYESAKVIFQKIIKRQKMWEKVTTFEKLSRDPSRFTNRGGTLLKEEKQRKGLMKELQRLDDDILHDVEEYEGKNCIPVLVSGMDYRTFIKVKWEEEQTTHPKKQAKDSPAQRTPHDRLLTCNPVSAPAKLVSAKPFVRIASSDKLTSFKPIARISPSDKLTSSPISSKNYAPMSRHGSIRKKISPVFH